MTPILTALWLLLVHGALGGFDTFYNHEWRERLPRRPEAATELALHSARSWAFALMFTGLAAGRQRRASQSYLGVVHVA